MIEKIDFGEQDTPYKSKKKRSHPKKANHKHEYQNVIIHAKYPKNYPIPRLAGQDYIALDSFCTKCGKLNYAQEDIEAKKLFPDFVGGHYLFMLASINSDDDKLKTYREWCNKHYPHYHMEDYNDALPHAGQTFINLNAVIWPKD